MLAQRFLGLFEADVAPKLASLRKSVVYGDANDHNVLVAFGPGEAAHVAGMIDFGDTHYGITISELATAVAYAILGKREVLAAAAAVVAGYHAEFPLSEEEIALLYPLVGARLAVSVVNSAHRKSLKPEDAYVTISEAPAWEALERWAKIFPRFANYTFRAACGLAPIAISTAVERYLRKSAVEAASILDADLRTEQCCVLDLSVGSRLLGADPLSTETPNLSAAIAEARKEAGARVAVGRYDEARLLYNAPQFGASKNPTDERRTIHLGIDLFVEPGSPLHAPLAGVVHILANNTIPLDYGPLVVLKHSTDDGEEFFTCYGHLTEQTFNRLEPVRRALVDLGAVRSSHFKIFGFSRTYWDFYVGFGLFVSVFLLLAAILAWQLGSLPTQTLRVMRNTVWTLSLCFAAVTVLSWMYFFIIPIVFSCAITVCLVLAAWRSARAA
jgi:murein DD-endopeptidase MepM/ murein hydrolase activator NlpD